jgi:IPTL-CTERM motif
MGPSNAGDRAKVIGLLAVLSFACLVDEVQGAQWAKGYGGAGDDVFSSVFPTADGGVIAAGATNSFGAGGYDVWLVKLDADGNVVWQRTYGGVGDDKANSVKPTLDGGYVVAGNTATPGGGFVLKVDAGGEATWQRTFAANSSIQAVDVGADGEYIVAGTTGRSAWTAKLDAGGNVTWQRTYTEPLGASLGGSTIQPTADGGYVLGGPYFFGSESSWVAKLDAGGSIVWRRGFYSPASRTASLYAPSARATPDGGYIVAGDLFSVALVGGGYVAFLIKLDASGNTSWIRYYYLDRNFSWTRASSAEIASDGGYIMTGSISDSGGDIPTVTKFDASGNISWLRTFGGKNFSNFGSIHPVPSGGYVLAASVYSTSSRSQDAALLKLDANGGILGCTGTSTLSTSLVGGISDNSGGPPFVVSSVGVVTVTGALTRGVSAATLWQPCDSPTDAPVTVTQVPALSDAAMILLAALVALCGAAARQSRYRK